MKQQQNLNRFIVCLILFIVIYPTMQAQANKNGILIVPFTINDQSKQPLLQKMISDMLYSRLNTTPCMPVVDCRKLVGDCPMDYNQIKQIAANKNLSHVLTGSVSIFGGQYSIDIQIMALDKTTPMYSHAVMASSEKAVIPKIHELSLKTRQALCPTGAITHVPQVRKKEKTGLFTYEIMPSLDKEVYFMTTADVNQDNHPELIMADKQTIFLFDISRNQLDHLGSYNGASAYRIIWLDAADIDKNQQPEIYVTAVHKTGGHLVSFVLIWDMNTLKVLLHDAPYYFRCFRQTDGTVHLIGQKQSLGDFFSKKACVLNYHQNKLLVRNMQHLPPNSHFVSFHQGRFTGAEKNYVIVQPNNTIEILDQHFRPKWVSETLYAESKNKLLMPPKTKRKRNGDHQEKFLYLNQRIVVHDVDHDHIDEIIVSEQHAPRGSRLFHRYRQYKNGTITCLKWNGLGMIPLWKTPEINGYISDYAWFDKNGTGQMCVAVATIIKNSMFKSSETQIILFLYQGNG